METTRDPQQSPGSEESDSLHLPDRKDPVRLSPAGQLLANFFEAMNASGEGAEEEYRAALEALRGRAAEAVIEAARLENACSTWDYPTRWGLVYAAAALEDPAALPFLRTLVLTPIPPERSPDPHSSTVAEETILRTTAVDGVAALARAGHKGAIEALFDFLSVRSFSVKRAAVQGLLAAEQGESLRGRIEEKLCPEDRVLLDIRPLDVRKAAQIENPEAHLSEDARADDTPPTPDLPDRRGRGAAQQKTQDRPPRGGNDPSEKRED